MNFSDHRLACLLRIVPILLTLTLLVGCGGAASIGGQNTIPQVQHVVVLVIENANYTDVIGSASTPYLNELARQGGLADNYYANRHPSLPNYFVITSGISPTTTDLANVVPIDNVVRELVKASKSWKVYAEALPSAGYLGPDIDPYYFRSFDAFTYFSDVQPPSQQRMNIVNFSEFSTDVASGNLPAYSFIIPDTVHNGHSCPDGGYDCDVNVKLAAADQWLSSQLPQLLQDPEFQQSGLLLITTDEARNDDTRGGGRVATVILGTGVKSGYVGHGLYDHRSLLSLSLTALGVTQIPNGAGSANQMTEFFGK